MTDYDHRTYEDPEETEQWENDKSRIDHGPAGMVNSGVVPRCPCRV